MSDDRELELDAEAGPDPRVLTAALSTALIGVVGLTMVLTPAGAPNTRLHEWWLALGVMMPKNNFRSMTLNRSMLTSSSLIA